MVAPWLNLVVIRTANLERAAEFYRLLGMTLVPEKHGKGPEHFSFSSGGIVFEIYLAKTAADVDATTRLGFTVADLSQVAISLQGKKFEIAMPIQKVENRITTVAKDCDGRKVEICEFVGSESVSMCADVHEISRRIATRIALTYRRPSMFGLNSPEALESVLETLHLLWEETTGRSCSEVRAEIRIAEGCQNTKFSNCFQERHPEAGRDGAYSFVLSCWKNISTKMKIIPFDDADSESAST